MIEELLPKSAWHPTKFIERRGQWIAAREGMGWGSRIVGDLQVAAYQRAISQHACGRLIDLGCGNAPLAGVYAPLVEQYEWADWANSPHQRFQLDHHVDLNQPLPFPDASYDTVLLTDVMEHVAEPDALFSELVRILRPGGRLIMGTPFLYWIHEEPHDYRRFTEFQYRRWAEQHGVALFRFQVAGGALDSWADLTAKLAAAMWRPLAFLPYATWRLARLVPPVRRLNERAAWRFPLAYVAVFALSDLQAS